jgi:heterotetrameric sarcosine oxidase gamma subunit
VSLEFLSVDAAALARSPMERAARRAGARFAVRDGWNVAVAYDGDGAATGWTDVSHLGKLELQAGAEALAEIVARCAAGAVLEPGTAARTGDAWWCPLTRTRALVICPAAETAGLRARLEQAAAGASGHVADVTTGFAALAVSGPAARELLARVSALDLRPRQMPVGAFRPGSLARTPGMVLRVAEDRYLALVGAALGEYLWTVVAEAGAPLGARPLGLDAAHA